MMLYLGSRVGICCLQKQSSVLETERKKNGETEEKSGTELKDNCSKKVNIAVKYPLQNVCALLVHKLNWIFFTSS